MEQSLTPNWAVEFNALHRDLKSTTSMTFTPSMAGPNGQPISSLGASTRTLTTWEFPILAKYRLPLTKLHPFFTAGPSFRPAGTGTQLSHAGITAGGGLEFAASGFRISPTLRYTRWSSANRSNFGGPLVNQVELLVGVDRPSLTPGFNAFGRRLSIGAIVGVGLGRDFRPGILSSTVLPESNSGIYGLMIEAPLPKNFSVEVDGLYRPLHGSDLEFSRRVRFAHLTWEFPVLLKHRWGTGRFHPFLEGGPSFRAEGNVNLRRVSHFGATLGGGVEAKLAWLKVAPTLRYTRWGGEANNVFNRTWPNQTQLLASFAF